MQSVVQCMYIVRSIPKHNSTMAGQGYGLAVCRPLCPISKTCLFTYCSSYNASCSYNTFMHFFLHFQKGVYSLVAHSGFLLLTTKSIMETIHNFCSDWIDCRGLCNRWLIAENRVSGGSRMGHLGQMPPPPPFKKLHTRSIYSNRAVNYSNKAVTMFMRQCSLPMKLQIGFYFT